MALERKQTIINLHSESAENITGILDSLTVGEIAVLAKEEVRKLAIKTSNGNAAYFIDSVEIENMIDAAVSGMPEEIKELQTAVENIKKEIGTKEEEYSTLWAAVAALAGRLDNHYTDIAKLQAISADTRLEALEASAHTHSNKNLLDTYTQTEANLADAVAKKHEHENKEVLDGITSNNIDTWNDALQTISKGTDGNYVTTTVGTKSDNNQTVGVALTIQSIEEAGDAAKGIAEASDVKAYVDAQVAGKNVTAEGDEYISASASNNNVTVSATDSTKTSLALADSALQKADITTGSENGNISVDGTDVAVKGLQDAAYTTVSALEATMDTKDNTLHTTITSEIATAKQEAIDSASTYTDTQINALNVTTAVGASKDSSDIVTVLGVKEENGKVTNGDMAYTFEDGAQVNVIEEIKLNGTAITPVRKSVDIQIASAIDGLKSDEKILSINNKQLGTTLSVDIVTSDGNDYIVLKGLNDTEVSKVNANKFIKSGMIKSATYDSTKKQIVIEFNTASGSDSVSINVADLVDTYTAGNGLNLNSNEFSIDLDDTTNTALSVSSNGLKLDLSGYTTTATTDAINTRLATAEGKINDLQGSAHTHDNKTVLDGITSAKVSAWDAAEQNAKDYADTQITSAIATETARTENAYAKITDLNTLSGQVGTNKTNIEKNASAIETIVDGEEINTFSDVEKALADKVDVVAGKQLSTEDYTTEEKTKLTGIEEDAQVNVIETVKVNGTALTITNKAVDIEIPSAFIEEVDETESVKLTVSGGTLTADVLVVDGGTF